MKYLLLIFCCSLFCSCQNAHKYSFFVAGHTYSQPHASTNGLHIPFVEKFDWLNSQEHIEFGVLTGDLLRLSKEIHWEATQEDLSKLRVEIFIAPGNHDVGWPNYFKQFFGKGFRYFQKQGDHFIILNPNLDYWNITGEQLDFLKENLKKIQDNGNIFVFVHQVLWWQEEGVFSSVRPNSFSRKADTLNFHPKVLPLFENILQKFDNQLFIFSGDVGAKPHLNTISYHKRDNIHLISSGMGGETKDNFLIVNVIENGGVEIEIVGLNCENGTTCLGSITDYLIEF